MMDIIIGVIARIFFEIGDLCVLIFASMFSLVWEHTGGNAFFSSEQPFLIFMFKCFAIPFVITLAIILAKHFLPNWWQDRKARKALAEQY